MCFETFEGTGTMKFKKITLGQQMVVQTWTRSLLGPSCEFFLINVKCMQVGNGYIPAIPACNLFDKSHAIYIYVYVYVICIQISLTYFQMLFKENARLPNHTVPRVSRSLVQPMRCSKAAQRKCRTFRWPVAEAKKNQVVLVLWWIIKLEKHNHRINEI